MPQVGVNRWNNWCNKFVKKPSTPAHQLIFKGCRDKTNLEKIKHYGLFALQISLTDLPTGYSWTNNTLYLLGVCDKTGLENRKPAVWLYVKSSDAVIVLASRHFRSTFPFIEITGSSRQAHWHWYNLETMSRYQHWNLMFTIFSTHSPNPSGL